MADTTYTENWTKKVQPFADAVGKTLDEITAALSTEVGEPNDQAVEALSNEDYTPFEALKSALRGLKIPPAILRKNLGLLRSKKVVAEESTSASMIVPWRLLRPVPDDKSERSRRPHSPRKLPPSAHGADMPPVKPKKEKQVVPQPTEEDDDNPNTLLSNILNNRPVKVKGPGSILLTIRCPDGDTLIIPVRTVESSLNKNGQLVLTLPGSNANTIHKSIQAAKRKIGG